MNKIIGMLILLFSCCTVNAVDKKIASLDPIGFKKGNGYTVIYYRITKDTFGGKVPDVVDFKYPHDDFNYSNAYTKHPESNTIFVDDTPVFHNDGQQGCSFRNYKNLETEIEIYVKGDIKNWQQIQLATVGVWLKPEIKKSNIFMNELINIKGIVSIGGNKEGVFDIGIAECIDIKAVLKKARKLAEKHGYKIGEVTLKQGHDYLLEEEGEK